MVHGVRCLLGRMPEHVSIPQQIGVAFLAIAAGAWAVGLVRLLRRDRDAIAVRRRRHRLLRALPGQSGPPVEAVELTPAERAAFAGLVRRFSESG